MIRFQRSIRVTRGNNAKALEWAKEVSDYVNGKHPKSKVQAFSSRFGDMSTLVWHVDFEDLASLDIFQQALGADPGYWDLVNKANDFFIEGTIHDTVFDEV